MRSFADFKRRLVPGLILQATNHVRPEASGQRTVTKVQGNGYWFTIAGRVNQSGERAGKPERFWYEWKSAKVCRIDGPNTVTFLTAPNGPPLVTLVFPDAADAIECEGCGDFTVPTEGQVAICRCGALLSTDAE